MAGSFSAADVRWQDQASCGEAEQIDFVPDNETQTQLTFVRGLFCDRCPVRIECLAYAVLYRARGYWGGTSTQERTVLGYPRNRVKCPVCLCKTLTTTTAHQICQGCGLSWRRADPEEGS